MVSYSNFVESITKNHFAQAGGVVLGIITFLVEPTAAFYALWVAVALDLLTRIIAQSVKFGGFWAATRSRHIQSSIMFRGTAIKILAYFCMTVLANQSRYIVKLEVVPIVFSTIIYSMLFLVEVHSIIENLIDAGAEDLNLLLLRLEREKEKAVSADYDGDCYIERLDINCQYNISPGKEEDVSGGPRV